MPHVASVNLASVSLASVRHSVASPLIAEKLYYCDNATMITGRRTQQRSRILRISANDGGNYNRREKFAISYRRHKTITRRHDRRRTPQDGAMHSRLDGQWRANSHNLYNLSDEHISTKKRQSVSQSVSQSVTYHRFYYVIMLLTHFHICGHKNFLPNGPWPNAPLNTPLRCCILGCLAFQIHLDVEQSGCNQRCIDQTDSHVCWSTSVIQRGEMFQCWTER